MIHPTRTSLLMLKEKARSVVGSIGILKARRLALIREFLATSAPFLRSREEIRTVYARAIVEMHLSLGLEGEEFIESLAGVCEKELGVEVRERSIMGLRFREVTAREDAARSIEARGYDYRLTTPHLEESLHRFENIIDAMLEIAAYESRLKRFGDEIIRVTRRIRVLEERILPGLHQNIKEIAHYLGERERESHYRLKRFKELLTGR